MATNKQEIAVYAIDLGNGFTKRTHDGNHICVEPSVFVETRLQIDDSYKGISINGGKYKHYGLEAIQSGYPLQMALGDQDSQRYESEQYLEILLGMIQKDCHESETLIQTLVLGLPNHHFKRHKKAVEQRFAKLVATIQATDRQQQIYINHVIVVPQPFGTYVHTAKGEDKTLIIDGGHGTIDASYFANSELVSDFSTTDGMKKAYEDILIYVKQKFPDTDYKLIEMSEMLLHGVKYRGQRYTIAEDTYVQEVLDYHFSLLYETLIANYGSFVKFDRVIWSGGMANIHAKRIQAKQESHFEIIREPQLANVLGFYELGVAVSC